MGLIGIICELLVKNLLEKRKASIGDCLVFHITMKRLPLEGSQIRCS